MQSARVVNINSLGLKGLRFWRRCALLFLRGLVLKQRHRITRKWSNALMSTDCPIPTCSMSAKKGNPETCFRIHRVSASLKLYMLFAGWEVRIVKNCDRGRRPRAAFSSPRSQFFTIRTDPKPVNNLFIFYQPLTRKKTHGKKLTQALL